MLGHCRYCLAQILPKAPNLARMSPIPYFFDFWRVPRRAPSGAAHVGLKTMPLFFFKDLFPSVSIYSPSEIKAVVSLRSGCSPPGHVSPITNPAQHCLVLMCQKQSLLMQAGRELMQASRGQGWDLSTTSGTVYFFYCPWPPLPPSANELPLFHST